MANTGFLSVNELSFSGIKDNLKTFMKAKTQFQDYDFEGSNLNALLDVLSYNTYLNAYYLNMIGSEMFLDSSQIRNSVVSHAKELNYVPRSRTSARAKVTFSVNTGGATPASVVIPKGYVARATIDNVTMDFTTNETIVLFYNGTSYVSDPVFIYEGKLVTEYFTVNGSTKYTLQSENVDTNSIYVEVINSSTDSTTYTYTKAENLYGLTSISKIFFVQGYSANQYEIVFGDGILGQALTNGNIVKVSYRSTNGEVGNKAYQFAATANIGTYPVTISTVTPAADGSERESTESIKLNAPRYFASQNRAVTKEDYINLLVAKYPQIKTVNVYGGEEVDPPQYGKVLISVVPYGTQPLISTELKNDIIAYLKTKSLITQPVVEDPEYLYVAIDSTVQFDPTLIQTSTQQLKTNVINKIIDYETNNLVNFGSDLRKSKLSAAIDSTDSSIVSNQTSVRAVYKIVPSKGSLQKIEFSFSNRINRPFQYAYTANETEVIKSSVFTYYQDGNFFDAYLSDDGVGGLRIYYLTPDSKQVILQNNVGTVDYISGKMSFNINAYDYSQNIDIFAKLYSDDIIVQNNKYLRIDYNLLSVTIVAASQ